jgi:hypothetical protein
MTTDVRTLLHQAAEAPDRAPDIGAAMQRGRVRRRRQRGFGALAAVVVATLVVSALALGSDGGDGAQVAIGPRQTNSEVPEGWKQIQADPGITIAIPQDWDSYDTGDTAQGPTQRVVVGTYAPLAGDGPSPCFAVPDGQGAWVRLSEYPAGTAQLSDPFRITLPVSPRPAAFRQDTNTAASAVCADNTEFTEFAFVDEGRVFLAEVMSKVVRSAEAQARLDELTGQINTLITQIAANPATEEQASLEAQLRALQDEYRLLYDQYGLNDARNLGIEVLNTLRVEPVAASATTTVPTVSTTAPRPTITTPPTAPATPFVPSTTDEQQINDLVVSWLRNHPDDETRAIVEDADALLGVIHQGLAQHSASDLEKYSGTVSAIRTLDADHAEVDYVLLFDGRPQFGVRTGIAVRINGHWMVSRATECSLLSLGGITCPPE